MMSIIFQEFKVFFGNTTFRTFPIIGNVFKRCARSNTAIFIPNSRIINIPTYCTYILSCHNHSFYFKKVYSYSG